MKISYFWDNSFALFQLFELFRICACRSCPPQLVTFISKFIMSTWWNILRRFALNLKYKLTRSIDPTACNNNAGRFGFTSNTGPRFNRQLFFHVTIENYNVKNENQAVSAGVNHHSWISVWLGWVLSFTAQAYWRFPSDFQQPGDQWLLFLPAPRRLVGDVPGGHQILILFFWPNLQIFLPYSYS